MNLKPPPENIDNWLKKDLYEYLKSPSFSLISFVPVDTDKKRPDDVRLYFSEDKKSLMLKFDGTAYKLLGDQKTYEDTGYPIYYGECSSLSDTYFVNSDSAVNSYEKGMVVIFIANKTNDGSASLDINGLGSRIITKNEGVELTANDIVAGNIVMAIYDGTNFQIQTGLSISDLGTMAYQNATSVDITGGSITASHLTIRNETDPFFCVYDADLGITLKWDSEAELAELYSDGDFELEHRLKINKDDSSLSITCSTTNVKALIVRNGGPIEFYRTGDLEFKLSGTDYGYIDFRFKNRLYYRDIATSADIGHWDLETGLCVDTDLYVGDKITAGELELSAPLSITQGGTGGVSAGQARNNLGLGTIATQDADDVNIDGGHLSSVTAQIVSGNITVSTLVIDSATYPMLKIQESSVDKFRIRHDTTYDYGTFDFTNTLVFRTASDYASKAKLFSTGNLHLKGTLTENAWSLDHDKIKDKTWELLKSCQDAFKRHDGKKLHPLLQKEEGGRTISDFLQIIINGLLELKDDIRNKNS